MLTRLAELLVKRRSGLFWKTLQADLQQCNDEIPRLSEEERLQYDARYYSSHLDLQLMDHVLVDAHCDAAADVAVPAVVNAQAVDALQDRFSRWTAPRLCRYPYPSFRSPGCCA
jgi:hypothetical protein